ncbi:MAG: hypothetical protein LUD00_09020 [Prevotellaceae bacterium]|nr:hypothetical protein [Prevotellaceae bacterium]
MLNSDLRTFDCEIGNLEDGCEYCIYPYAQNGSSSGDMTEGDATVVTTVKYEKPVLSVSPLEFVSAGHVRAAALVRKGNHEIIEQGFCYSSETEKPVLGAHGKAESDMDAEGHISAEIVFENSSITYWVRAYAKDDKDSVNYSETVKFEPSDFYGLTKQGR